MDRVKVAGSWAAGERVQILSQQLKCSEGHTARITCLRSFGADKRDGEAQPAAVPTGPGDERLRRAKAERISACRHGTSVKPLVETPRFPPHRAVLHLSGEIQQARSRLGNESHGERINLDPKREKTVHVSRRQSVAGR